MDSRAALPGVWGFAGVILVQLQFALSLVAVGIVVGVLVSWRGRQERREREMLGMGSGQVDYLVGPVL